MAEAYTALGRPDLADCVRGGKVHQRLGASIRRVPSLAMMRGLADALAVAPGGSVPFPTDCGNLARWCEWMAERCWNHDPVLRRLMAGNQSSWTERCGVKAQFEWA